jgi:hypothetical protein
MGHGRPSPLRRLHPAGIAGRQSRRRRRRDDQPNVLNGKPAARVSLRVLKEIAPVITIDSSLLVGGVISLVSASAGALFTDWRIRRAEDRASLRSIEFAVAGWRRGILRDTRIALRRQLAQLEAIVLGDVETAERHGLEVEQLDVNAALVGDAEAIRAYQDVIVVLRRRLGRGLPPGYTVPSAKAMALVLEALDAQEERLLRGEPLKRVDPAVAPELFAPEGFAARLKVPWRLPSWWAVLARYALDLMEWLDRRLPERAARSPRPDRQR